MKASDVRERWARRTGEFSPRYYAYYGPDESSETIKGVLDDRTSRDAAVLEVGCSSGRHLAHLAAGGYENVNGVEINEEALDVMAEEYPSLAERGTFHASAIESFVPDVPDRAYDVLYSVQTLQHVHPESSWIFDELRRITDELIVTVEIEDGIAPDEDPTVDEVDGMPLVHRNWKTVFDGETFEQVASERVGTNTLRVFARREP